MSVPSHIVSHLTVVLGPYLTVWVVSLSTTDVITRRVSPVIPCMVFEVCIGLVSLDDPLAETEPYPHTLLHEALPK